MNRDHSYLRHISDAIARIEQYLTGIDKPTFLQTPLVQDGVIRQLEIIGEATKNLSSDLKDKYDQVPWRDIARMRDKLIHHYFGVDLDTVWLTAKEDIPVLQKEVQKILG